MLLAGAAQRHFLKDRDVIADHGGFTHDKAGTMVEEDAPADRHRRMDIDGEDLDSTALQEMG